MKDGDGIRDAVARDQLISKALKGEKGAWNSLMKAPWAYLDDVIKDAAAGDVEALETLLNDPWLYVIFCRIAEWAERKYKFAHDQHGADVVEVLSATIRLKITDLDNRNNVAWRRCLRCFAFSIAKFHCLNYLTRGRHAEEEYWDSVAYEHTPGRRNGKDMVEPCETMKLREEEREEAREEARREALREGQTAAIKEAIGRVFGSLAPDGKRMVSLWVGKRMTYEQIAAEMGMSRATVGRRFKDIFKVFIGEIEKLVEELKAGGQEVEAPKVIEHLMGHRAAELRKLIAPYIHNPAPFDPGLPAAA
ncbi:MAG TPA: hypothetical protein VF588_19285 [Pyrinomonadaceae bacterium]|jgi:RNA polymerase sigma factor (sigma-70 family)